MIYNDAAKHDRLCRISGPHNPRVDNCFGNVKAINAPCCGSNHG
jgi:hypothetical protein